MTDLDIDTIDSLLEASLKNGNKPVANSSNFTSTSSSSSSSSTNKERDHSSSRDRHHHSRHSHRSRRSRSRSRRSRSRSRDYDRDYYHRRRRSSRSRSPYDRKRSRSRDRKRRSRSPYDRRRSRSPRYKDHQKEEKREEEMRQPSEENMTEEERRLRDEKTAFISNLPIKASREEIQAFFDSKGAPVFDVRIITDKNTRKSKGVAYIEFKTKEDMQTAMNMIDKKMMGQTFYIQPTFAEKNAIALARAKQIQMMQQQMPVPPIPQGLVLPPMGGLHSGLLPPGINIPPNQPGLHPLVPIPNSGINPLQRPIMLPQQSVIPLPSSRLLVTQLHELTTESDLNSIFSYYGEINSIDIPLDEQGTSKGHAFIKFVKPESARNAALKLDGKEIAGRKIRIKEVKDDATAEELDDDDGNIKTKIDQKTRVNLMQKLVKSDDLSGLGGPIKIAAPRPVQSTTCIKLSNAFDPSEETSPTWEQDLKEDFIDECNKFGPVEICVIHVESKHVYIKFFDTPSAQSAIQVLHGRWFGGRQLQVEFVDEKEIPKKK